MKRISASFSKPSIAWLILFVCVVGMAAYFMSTQGKKEDVLGRAANPTSPLPLPSVEANQANATADAPRISNLSPAIPKGMTPNLTGGMFKISDSTAKTIRDYALGSKEMEPKLMAYLALPLCVSIKDMDADFTASDGTVVEKLSNKKTAYQRSVLAKYIEFCSSLSPDDVMSSMKEISKQLAASGNYFQSMRKTRSDAPLSQEQMQASISALTSPEQSPSSVYRFIMSAAGPAAFPGEESENPKAARIFAYRELSGDVDPMSAANAFACINNDVCESNREIDEKFPGSANAGKIFVQAVRRQDWRAIGLQ